MPSGADASLVFGAVSLGLPYGLRRSGAGANQLPSDDDVRALVEGALALGVDTFDTAPAYGTSEERLGAVLGGRAAVWTKVTAGDPAASLATSLDRLGRSSVDVLQWHNWSAKLASDPAWVERWTALRGDPRVKRLGATTYGVADAVAAVNSGLFELVQVEFNLLVQGVVNAIAPDALARRVDIAVRSVLLQGALTDEGRDLPQLPTLREGVRRARDLAREGGGLTALAMRAAIEHPAIRYVLIGFDRTAQLQDAVRIAKGPRLTDALHERARALDLSGDPACDPRNWR